jgi:hypothetical protein
MSDEPKDKVGYKRPPTKSQFKPGRSGNPKGRPKGAKSFATVLEAELTATVPVTMNGKRKKLTRRAAIVKQFVNRAVNGDTKSTLIVLNEARTFENKPVEEQSEFVANTEDKTVIDSLMRRWNIQIVEEQGEEGSGKSELSSEVLKNSLPREEDGR